MTQTFKVSTKSNANSVAGALAAALKTQDSCVLSTVGAGALNQATKAVIIARGFLIPQGIDVCIVPSFEEIEINKEKRTSIKLTIEKKC